MTKITVGDHVSIPSHTSGTVRESGYVKHINRSGALIKYGATKRGGIYGSRERVPLGELVKLAV